MPPDYRYYGKWSQTCSPTWEKNVEQPGIKSGQVGMEPGAVGRCGVRVADPVAAVTPRQVVGIVVHLQLGQRHLSSLFSITYLKLIMSASKNNLGGLGRIIISLLKLLTILSPTDIFYFSRWEVLQGILTVPDPNIFLLNIFTLYDADP